MKRQLLNNNGEDGAVVEFTDRSVTIERDSIVMTLDKNELSSFGDLLERHIEDTRTRDSWGQ